MDIDQAIDHLAQVVVAADLPPLRAPGPAVKRKLADIVAAITPLRLPVDIATFWRRVDVLSVPLDPFPALTGLDFALDCWQNHERDQRMTPTLLFPIAYASHCFTFTELAGEHGPGGTLFNWAYDGDDFRITHPDLSAYLDQLATTIELGDFTRERQPDGAEWYQLDPENRWDEIASVRLAGALPLPRYGRRCEIEDDVRYWPEHWLRASGLTEQTRTARGATTTIAALLTQAGSGMEARGTVHARVRRSAGTATGSRVTIEDGTAPLDLWCPSSVSAHLPGGDLLEFDVVVRPGPPGPPKIGDLRRQIQDSALSGDLDAAQQPARDLYARLFETQAAAEATAIRPLP